MKPPYRADQVGTFLRPAELLAAREKHQKGALSTEELRSIEDKYIEDLVAKQKKNGLRAITDGDFRRGHWFIDFLVGLEGVDMHYESSADGFDSPVLEVVG
jgi:5-methyltetrahydropteroyltriglutamate--homocysteine methyltransferase